MLLTFAIALTLTVDGPYLAVDRLAGISNLAELLAHLTGLLGIGLLTYLLIDVEGRPRSSRRVEFGTLVAVLIVSVVLFALADAPVEAPRFTSTYGSQWPVAVFWLIAAVYALACLVRLAWTVARSTSSAGRLDVIHGMRVAAIGGGLFGAAYIAFKAVDLADGTASVVDGTRSDAEQACLVAGMLCLAGGIGVPMLHRAAADLARQVRLRAALIRLRPIRERMRRDGLIEDLGMPLASNATVVVDLLGLDAHARLVRRVVEIRDGLLASGSQMPPSAPRFGAHGRTLDVVDEARRLSQLPVQDARAETTLAS